MELKQCGIHKRKKKYNVT